MNKIIKPFCGASVMLSLLCLLFPAMTVALFTFCVSNGFSGRNIIGLILGIVVSFLVSKPLVLTLISSEISFNEDGFKIRYFENLKTFNKNNIFTFPKYKTVEFKYSEITEYGVFKSGELRKGGQDDLHRIIFLFYKKNKAIPVIMPKVVDDLQEFMIFNDSNGTSVVLDTKMYSRKQVLEIFHIIKTKSNKSPLKNMEKLALPPWSTGGLLIGLICLGILIGFKLMDVDQMLVPSHDKDYNSIFRVMYLLGPAFSSIGLGGFLLCKFNSNEKPETLDSVNSAKILFLTVIIGGIIATIAGFFLSIAQG